jgi:hypothetical protein
LRPKDLTEDINKLISNSTQQITYSPTMEEDIEYLGEYTWFISELLTEFRDDKVYVMDMHVANICHPEGWRRFHINLDSDLVDTPMYHQVLANHQLMYTFERLRYFIRQELSLNREVFIYSITPFRHTDVDGEIRYRPSIRWVRLPLEMWYNDLSSDPFMVIKKIKKHEL